MDDRKQKKMQPEGRAYEAGFKKAAKIEKLPLKEEFKAQGGINMILTPFSKKQRKLEKSYRKGLSEGVKFKKQENRNNKRP